MSLTRFSDDPCRIQKYLEETTNIGNYHLNVPGFGDKPYFINDPFVRMEKWGANLLNNKTELENDLLGLTRKLNRDTKDNIHESNKLLLKKDVYPIHNEEITNHPRVTDPAWTLRELDSINTPNIPNNFKYLHMDPQEHVCIPFHNNVASRIVEKDYFRMNEQ